MSTEREALAERLKKTAAKLEGFVGDLGYWLPEIECIKDAAAVLAQPVGAGVVGSFAEAWPDIQAQLPGHLRNGYTAGDVENAEKEAAEIAWDLATLNITPPAPTNESPI